MPDEKMKYPLLEFEYDKKLYEELLTLNPHPEFMDRVSIVTEDYEHDDFGSLPGDEKNALGHAAGVLWKIQKYGPSFSDEESKTIRTRKRSHTKKPDLLLFVNDLENDFYNYCACIKHGLGNKADLCALTEALLCYGCEDTVWEEVLKLYRENIMDNETIIRWNFINIINNFFQKQYDGIQEDLFQIVTFANNNGDNFTKNILKTLLGKVLKDNDNVKQAIEIYNDQIAYFAKEKMAVGALLTWFLIADATLITDGAQSAMEIAEQALEVAQNPKIDSYFFTVLLKMVIAKCAITTSDFETAKIHLENAISLAKKFNMNDLLSRLYILYGKYFQELGLVKSAEQIEYLQNAEKMYKNAEELIAKTKNKYILKELRQSGKSLTTFCVMNNIKI